MAVQVSYPGVYIDEFAPGAPIEGVGTSTAAFIGPSAKGDLDEPIKITSWDQFIAEFGDHPLPGFQLWYAVRGFFENGGQVCYLVRVSNGEYAETTLVDRSAAGNDVIRVRARQPGNPATAVQVEVTSANLIPAATTSLFQPTATVGAAGATGRDVELGTDEGINFKPGDWITIAAAGERVQILQVIGDRLRLVSNLTGTYTAGDTVRLADAPVSTRTVRIRPAAAFPSGRLVPGTILTITQGGLSDSQIVDSVQSEPIAATPTPFTTYRGTFRRGLDIALSLDPTNAATVQSEEFNFQVSQGGAPISYPNLSIDAAHPRYFVDVINALDSLIQVELVEPPPPVNPPENLPAATGAPVDLTGGTNEDLMTMGNVDYIDALDIRREVDDVNMIAIPDAADSLVVQQAVIAHCEQLGDRFAVLDALMPVPNQPLFGANSVEAQRLGLDSTRGYAALFYPWLRVAPAGAGAPILVPPSAITAAVSTRRRRMRLSMAL